MKKYLKELHAKPEIHRKRVAYGASAAITVLIGFVWFTSFGYLNGLHVGSDYSNNVADQTDQTDQTSSQVAVSPIPSVTSDETNASPFSVIGNNVSNALDAVRSALGIKVTTKDSRQNATPTLQYVPE